MVEPYAPYVKLNNALPLSVSISLHTGLLSQKFLFGYPEPLLLVSAYTWNELKGDDVKPVLPDGVPPLLPTHLP